MTTRSAFSQVPDVTKLLAPALAFTSPGLTARLKQWAAVSTHRSAMIEPLLILFVGGVVGFVYFAFFQAVMTVSAR